MKNKKNIVRAIAMFALLLILLSVCLMCTACGNMSIIDTTWSFERAIVFLPDGEKIEGKVSSWVEYDGSDMIQVTIEGKTYLTHSSNVVMISE